MDTRKINEAAKEHAKKVLGEDQFKKNKSAVKAISEDFKAGVKWLQSNEK